MIGLVVTSGTFALDGQEFAVDNNVWIVGDDEQVIVIDAAHDRAAIERAIGGRRVIAIVATHAHNDHINVAAQLSESVQAPVLLHRDDLTLWRQVYPSRDPDEYLADGQHLSAGRRHLVVLHTPGHTPGGCSLYVAEEGACFTGDTLFKGGPGATGRSFSDFPTIIDSIRTRLLTLPPETALYPGHGPATSSGEEAPHLGEWITRGY